MKKITALFTVIVLMAGILLFGESQGAAAQSSTSDADLVITDARGLNEFAQKVNNGNTYAGKVIKLANDIRFDGVTVNNFTVIGSARWGNSGFEGIFDGCGHTISGIVVVWSDESYGVGLFGKVLEKGVVQNVTVADSEFTIPSSATNNPYIGSIAGYNSGLINNCRNIGTSVQASATLGDAAGGLVGYSAGTILNSSSSGQVLASDSTYVGGIAGANAGKIYNSCNTGDITILSVKDPKCQAGGITGLNSVPDNAEVQNCYNTGTVSAPEQVLTGGIAGQAGGIVANSYCSKESAKVNFGEVSGVERNCKAYPASYMQTNEFLNLLNSNRGDNGDKWLKWEFRGESLYPVHIESLISTPVPTGSRQPIVCSKKIYQVAYGVKPFRLDVSSGGQLTYHSSDDKIVSVDANGMVTVRKTGIAEITVRLSQSNYSVKITVEVSPKKQVIKSLKNGKNRKITVKCTKDKMATGYQVQISTKKNFKKLTQSLKKKGNVCTLTKLKAGKKYYIRCRSYKKVGNSMLRGAWSAPVKSKPVKK